MKVSVFLHPQHHSNYYSWVSNQEVLLHVKFAFCCSKNMNCLNDSQALACGQNHLEGLLKHTWPPLWKCEAGELLEVRSSRTAWPTWLNPVSVLKKNTKIRQAWWHMTGGQLLWRLRQKNNLNLGDGGCSEPGQQSKMLSQEKQKHTYTHTWLC